MRAAIVTLLAIVPSLSWAGIAIPPAAERYRARLIREARLVWGIDAPVSTIAAQLHQESGWRPDVVSRAGAVGMAQFMPATAAWASKSLPTLNNSCGADDGDCPQGAGPLSPAWAIRALVTYDRWLWERVSARDDCERMAMSLSAYNGGLGWISRDQAKTRAVGKSPDRWWGHVATVNSGRAPAAWSENRGYPSRIILTLQPLYVAASWGPGVCA